MFCTAQLSLAGVDLAERPVLEKPGYMMKRTWSSERQAASDKEKTFILRDLLDKLPALTTWDQSQAAAGRS